MLQRLLASMILGLVLTATGAAAEPLDDPSARALEQTLRSLRGGGAAAIEQQDPRLAPIARSPELTDELYDVAGAVLTELAERYDGDPERMSEALAKAKSDPEGFAAALSPATRAKLAELSAKLPAE